MEGNVSTSAANAEEKKVEKIFVRDERSGQWWTPKQERTEGEGGCEHTGRASGLATECRATEWWTIRFPWSKSVGGDGDIARDPTYKHCVADQVGVLHHSPIILVAE